MRWTLTPRTSESDCLEMGPLKSKSVKRRPLKWLLPRCDWVPGRGTHTGLHREKTGWGYSEEEVICSPKREASVETTRTDIVILDLESSKWRENTFCCLNHRVYSISLWQEPAKPMHRFCSKLSFKVLSPSFHLLFVLPFFLLCPSLPPSLSSFSLSTYVFSSSFSVPPPPAPLPPPPSPLPVSLSLSSLFWIIMGKGLNLPGKKITDPVGSDKWHVIDYSIPEVFFK